MVLPMQHQGSMGKPQHVLWLANKLRYQVYQDSHSQNTTMGLGNTQAWGETKHGSQQCCYDWPKSHYGWKTLAYWHQRYLCQTETLLLNLCLHLPCNDTVKQQATSRQSCYNNFAPLNFELSPRTPMEGSVFLLEGWCWSQVFCSRCQTAHKKLCCSAHGIWLQFHEAWGRPIHTYMCFFPSPRIWNAITGFLAWQRFHTVTFGLETWRPLLEVKRFFLFFCRTEVQQSMRCLLCIFQK